MIWTVAVTVKLTALPPIEDEVGRSLTVVGVGPAARPDARTRPLTEPWGSHDFVIGQGRTRAETARRRGGPAEIP
jgi:hypothetical protein